MVIQMVNREIKVEPGLGALLLFCGAALALFGCSQPQARLAVVREAWSEEGFEGLRITTPHFIIYSTLSDKPFEEALPGFLEAAFKRYEATFSTPAPEPIRLDVYVFGRREEWENFTRLRYPANFDVYRHIRSGGFTEGSLSVSFYTSRFGAWSTMAHEGWHQYLAARVKRPVPAWINEGLACYHEAVSFAGREPVFTPLKNVGRSPRLRDAFQRDQLIPLGALVRTDAGQAITHEQTDRDARYYAQVWALIAFLRDGPNQERTLAFGAMLSDLADGTFHAKVSEARLRDEGRRITNFGELAFVHYFGSSPDELSGAYREYLPGLLGLGR